MIAAQAPLGSRARSRLATSSWVARAWSVSSTIRTSEETGPWVDATNIAPGAVPSRLSRRMVTEREAEARRSLGLEG